MFNNKYENKEKKYYKIFIMTKDNYYFIVEKRKLYKSGFFNNIFQLDKTSGNIRNPLFLKNIECKYLKYILKYLEHYFNNNDDNYIFDKNEIKYYDINKYFNNDFDKDFFKDIIEDKDENLINNLKYFDVYNLNKKLELCLFFMNNKLNN